jgi:hypothetical protein
LWEIETLIRSGYPNVVKRLFLEDSSEDFNDSFVWIERKFVIWKQMIQHLPERFYLTHTPILNDLPLQIANLLHADILELQQISDITEANGFTIRVL